jgi:hypothetical protein
MEVADDADGRVAIFSLDVASADPEPAPPTAEHRRDVGGGVGRHLSEALDNRYAPVFIGAALVVILVLGLVLARH